MTPTNVKHAVFQASRHGDSSATVEIVGAFGTLGIVVPAAGNGERMTEEQTAEAFRHALGAMAEASESLKAHLDHIAPEPAAQAPKAADEPAPIAAEPTPLVIPLESRFA